MILDKEIFSIITASLYASTRAYIAAYRTA